MGDTASSLAEALVKRLVYDVLVKAVIARAVTVLPFLGYPIIGPIFGYLVGRLARPLAEELIKFADNFIIDIREGAKQQAYQEAKAELLEELLRREPGDHESFEAAKEEFKRRLAELVRLDRAA